jgi:hypothetical protein
MKLNIPTMLFSLFSSFGHATVSINDVPSHLKVGQEVVLSWSSDRDYVRTKHATQLSHDIITKIPPS